MGETKFEFSDKFLFSSDGLPTDVFEFDGEQMLADGSVLIKHEDDYYEHRFKNGVVRIYSYGEDENYHLMYEALPDGRAKGYTENGDVIYEKDEQGNYHLDKPETEENYRVVEDGTRNGWMKCQWYEANKLVDELNNDDVQNLSMNFSSKRIFKEEELSATIFEFDDEKWLADGSILIEHEDDYYEHRFANGVVRFYQKEENDDEEEQYRLIYETLPNKKVRAYDEEENVIYECDERGKYHLDKPETDDDYRVVEDGTREGWDKRQWYESDETPEEESNDEARNLAMTFSSKLTFNESDFPMTILEFDDEKWLADGSILIDRNGYSEHRLANGTVRIYDQRGDDYQLLFEKLPNGQAKAYYEDDVIYECDEQGNYHLEDPESYYDPKIVEDGTREGWLTRQTYKDDELLEDKTNDVKPSLKAEFCDKLVLREEDLPTVILEMNGEKWYADGSVYKDDYYRQKLPNGTVRLYEEYYDEYHLVYEALSDGKVRCYDGEENIIYECDERGNYHLDKPETDDAYRTVEDGTRDGWVKRQFYESDVLIDEDEMSDAEFDDELQSDEMDIITIRDNTEDGHYIKKDKDNHILEEGNNYTYKKYFVNGTVRKEKTIDGDVYTYNEDSIKIAEELSDGTKRRWTNDGRVLILEHFEGGDHREWYASGRKKVERNARGRERRWRESPFMVSYEREPSGAYKKYDIESRVIEEFDGSHKVKYAYHGRTRIYSHVHHYDMDEWGRFEEDRDKYQHFQSNGVEDTEKYLALKMVAEERVSDEDTGRRPGKMKRVLNKVSRASKISKIKKYMDMYKASKKLKKGREAARYTWPTLSDDR